MRIRVGLADAAAEHGDALVCLDDRLSITQPVRKPDRLAEQLVALEQRDEVETWSIAVDMNACAGSTSARALPPSSRRNASKRADPENVVVPRLRRVVRAAGATGAGNPV